MAGLFFSPSVKKELINNKAELLNIDEWFQCELDMVTDLAGATGEELLQEIVLASLPTKEKNIDLKEAERRPG